MWVYEAEAWLSFLWILAASPIDEWNFLSGTYESLVGAINIEEYIWERLKFSIRE